jgi:molybdopterin molybdotransferase
MTGVPFPVGPDGDQFDCCVPIEDVVLVENKLTDRRYISLSKPAKSRQHRRLAGGDFTKDDQIIGIGERVNPQHIMAMASVGLTEVPVLRKPRIANLLNRLRIVIVRTFNSSIHDPRCKWAVSIGDSQKVRCGC